jgi:hypothetical protein
MEIIAVVVSFILMVIYNYYKDNKMNNTRNNDKEKIIKYLYNNANVIREAGKNSQQEYNRDDRELYKHTFEIKEHFSFKNMQYTYDLLRELDFSNKIYRKRLDYNNIDFAQWTYNFGDVFWG